MVQEMRPFPSGMAVPRSWGHPSLAALLVQGATTGVHLWCSACPKF